VEDLRRKYKRAIMTAKDAGLSGFIGERDGRLFFKGTVGTPEQAMRIWTAIKQVPSWRNEVIGDIQVRSLESRHCTLTRNSGDKPA
jgi:hypothetical protein